MLELLFGGKNMEMALLFLFVNGKCYGTQLHNALKTPLTPIQKALSRLEKSGIVLSYYEGKTRLYQFNSDYPLLEELECLLKKAHTLLSVQEKKLYSFVKTELPNKNALKKDHLAILKSFWQRLLSVTALTFNAKTNSKEKGGWNGQGKGEVIITQAKENVLIFNEKGSWKDAAGHEVDFTNVFRWTLDTSAKVISLEHLRRGINHPVFLFHLIPSADNILASADSHLCKQDAYFGQILCNKTHLRLNWRVIGPKKNEELDYFYT